jgi:hypothetical protein
VFPLVAAFILDIKPNRGRGKGGGDEIAAFFSLFLIVLNVLVKNFD